MQQSEGGRDGGGGSVSVNCLRWKSKASIQWLNGVRVSVRPPARMQSEVDWERRCLLRAAEWLASSRLQ